MLAKSTFFIIFHCFLAAFSLGLPHPPAMDAVVPVERCAVGHVGDSVGEAVDEGDGTLHLGEIADWSLDLPSGYLT